MRVAEEMIVEVCDDEGDEHEVTVFISGLWTQPSRHDPGEQPDIEVVDAAGLGPEMYEEIERVAWESFLREHYQK